MLRLFLDKCLYYLADILIVIILVRIPFLVILSINKALRFHLLNISLFAHKHHISFGKSCYLHAVFRPVSFALSQSRPLCEPQNESAFL